MDFSSFKSFAAWIGGFSALLFAAGLLYVMIRTQSLHVLRVRIWQLIFGKEGVTDPIAKNFIEQQSSLMAFRLFSNLSVVSLEELKQLQDWAKSRDISLLQLSGIARFFDISTRSIKLPYPLLYKFLNCATLVLTVSLTVLSFYISLEQRASIRVLTTDHWYWVDAQEAHASLWNWPIVPATSAHVFTRNTCTMTEKKPLIGFEVQDQQVICDLWQQQDDRALLLNLLKTQRWMALYFLVIFGSMMSWRILRASQLQMVEKLRPQIHQ